MNLKQPLSFGSVKGRLPKKTTMNLYVREKNGNSLSRVLPATVLVIVLVAVICKFGVVDRLARVNELNKQVEAAQNELAAYNAALTDFDKTKADYVRYTDYYRTAEESSLMNRLRILDLIRNTVSSCGRTDSVSIVGNSASVRLTVRTLDDVAVIRETLECAPAVVSVNIYNASKGEDSSTGSSWVEASMLVQFADREEDDHE